MKLTGIKDVNPCADIKILLIDDDEDDLLIFTELISEINYTQYQLDWVTTYDEGLDQIKNQEHDIYFIDYRLGIENGLELLKKSIEFGCDKPMVILTGKGNCSIDNQAMESGAYDYLVKDELNATRIERSIRYVINSYNQKKRIKESEDRFRKLIEVSYDGISISVDGIILEANDSFVEMFGYDTVNKVIGKTPRDFVSSETADMILEKIRQQNEESYTLTVIKKDGTDFTVEIFGKSCLYKGKPARITAFKDISESKKAEDKLRKSEEKYRSLFENMTNGFAYCKMIFDENNNPIDWIYLEINDVFERITGIKRDIIGKKVTEAIPGIENDIPELFEKYGKVARTGEDAKFEIYFDTLKIWFYVQAFSPKEEYFVAIFEDVTEQKIAEEELQTTREQLFQAQKMEAIGRTMGSIAHDFNNILTLLTLDTEKLLITISPDDPAYLDVEKMLQRIKTAISITSEFLSFIRPRKRKQERVNLNEILEKYLSTLGQFINKNIKQIINFDPQIGEIVIDPIHLEQVILNLIINAIDAMPKGGILSLETKNIPVNQVIYQGQYNTQQHVKLTISDTGIGMNNEIQERIFEAFYTTKEEGKGSGLGLAIVYSIITQNNGFIKVDSKINKGTQMSIYIPSVTVFDSEKKEGMVMHKKSGLERQILLIDDDKDIRTIIKEVLETNNFNVTDVGDPIKAMKLFEKNHEHIKFVISGVLMPKLLGSDLVAQLQKIKPSIKVLFITGNANVFRFVSSNLKSNMDILQKPFDTNTLINKLKAL